MNIRDAMQYWVLWGKKNQCPILKCKVRAVSDLASLCFWCPSAEWRKCFCPIYRLWMLTPVQALSWKFYRKAQEKNNRSVLRSVWVISLRPHTVKIHQSNEQLLSQSPCWLKCESCRSYSPLSLRTVSEKLSNKKLNKVIYKLLLFPFHVFMVFLATLLLRIFFIGDGDVNLANVFHSWHITKGRKGQI